MRKLLLITRILIILQYDTQDPVAREKEWIKSSHFNTIALTNNQLFLFISILESKTYFLHIWFHDVSKT